MIKKTITKNILLITSTIFLFFAFYTGTFASDQCYIDVNIGIHNASSTGVEQYSFKGLDHYPGDYSDDISLYDPEWGGCSLNTYDSSSTLLQKYSFIDSSYVFGEYYDKDTDEMVGTSDIQENSVSTVLIPPDEKTKFLKLSCDGEETNLAELQPRDLMCYKEISDCYELQDINLDTSANYILTDDIDCTGINFKPLAENTPFTGTLDGAGYTIKNLTITNSAYNYPFVGLFGRLAGTVEDLKIDNANINGWNDFLHLGGATVGGIAGYQAEGSSITDSSFNGTIVTKWNAGGLVGESNGNISSSYSLGSIYSTYYSYKSWNSHLSVGGLVGIQGSTGNITDSYSGATVGVGEGYPSDIQQVGGIAGDSKGVITNSYAYGKVNGGYWVGRFVGGGIVSTDYNGAFSGTVSNSYWDKQTSGVTTSGGGVGKTTADMKATSTYANWDFANTWNFTAGDYPHLQSFGIQPSKISSPTLKLSMSLSPSSVKYDFSTNGATSTINWTIVGKAKSCKAVEQGYTYDTNWLHTTINPAEGSYSTTTKLIQYAYDYSTVYGIECTTDDGSVVDATSSLQVTH